MSANHPKIVVDFDQHRDDYRDRYPEISHELRGKCPVTWSESHGGYWVVTGLEEVAEFYRHPELFSAWKDTSGRQPQFEGIQIPRSGTYQAGFLEMDPPEQLEYRRILNPLMSPAAVRKWEPLVADFTRACINDVIENGELDFVDDIANIVPAVFTLAALGLPLADWEIYCEPTHAQVYTKPGTPEMDRVLEMSMRMQARLAVGIAEIRAKPRPGMIKALIDGSVNGQPLPDEGILGTVSLLIGGGFDTTTALTANAWNWLAQHPDGKARLLADKSLLDTATEEFLRYFTPAQGDARTVTRDCEVAGYAFNGGDRVLMSFAMPNRDPRTFPEPDVIKLDRFPNRHAAFGLGNHRCIGSNIARMNFKVIMWETLQRIPEYTIIHERAVRYDTIGVINGFQHLPATFAPGRRDGPGLAETLARWQAMLDDEADQAAC